MIRNGVSVAEVRRFVNEYAERCNNDHGCKRRGLQKFAKEKGFEFKHCENAYYAKDNKQMPKRTGAIKQSNGQKVTIAGDIINTALAQQNAELTNQVKRLEEQLQREADDRRFFEAGYLNLKRRLSQIKSLAEESEVPDIKYTVTNGIVETIAS